MFLIGEHFYEILEIVQYLPCVHVTGVISSSNSLASPPDILIQPIAPHRRARSAAWTYHFCDDAWVDLTISLPCAVLLKEVQLVPHVTSLASECYMNIHS